jgi:CheY-like chemotaxis protein
MKVSRTKLGSVLLVDDDEVTNFYNEHLILKCGISDHVVQAMNGKEALEYLKGKNEANPDFRRPDLILLDINMPIMNGFEFLDEYESLPTEEKAGHVIVMLTTSMLDVDKQRASRYASLSSFFTKPLTESQLLGLVDGLPNGGTA